MSQKVSERMVHVLGLIWSTSAQAESMSLQIEMFLVNGDNQVV
jgi:hypothetical protein